MIKSLRSKSTITSDPGEIRAFLVWDLSVPADSVAALFSALPEPQVPADTDPEHPNQDLGLETRVGADGSVSYVRKYNYWGPPPILGTYHEATTGYTVAFGAYVPLPLSLDGNGGVIQYSAAEIYESYEEIDPRDYAGS